MGIMGSIEDPDDGSREGKIMYYRVSIINQDGSFSILDKTFSQICEMLRGVTSENRDQFWDKKRIPLTTGETVVFVKEV